MLELTQRARTAAGAIAFDTFGEGPPVVLVHGTPSRALVWRNVVPELARSRRVFVFDMLGFGASERHLDQDVACFYEADAGVRAAVPSLAVPVLVLWAEHDAWLALETSARIAELIPGAQRVVLEGAGHFSMEDRPRAVAEALDRFL